MAGILTPRAAAKFIQKRAKFIFDSIEGKGCRSSTVPFGALITLPLNTYSIEVPDVLLNVIQPVMRFIGKTIMDVGLRGRRSTLKMRLLV